MGRDLMKLLKVDVKYSSDTLEWVGNGKIPLKPLEVGIDMHFFIDDPDELMAEVDRISSILDTKYAKDDLEKVSEANPHLNKKEK